MTTTPDGYPRTAATAVTGMACSAAEFMENILREKPDILDHALSDWDTIRARGDAYSQLSSWSLTGGTTSNTNYGKLYWELSNATTTRTVNLYKTSAKAAGDKVATGNRSGDGSITLSASNTSGLSGSVTVAYTIDDTDTGNILFYKPTEVALEDIRINKVWPRVTTDLLNNPNLPDKKIEYLEALEDVDALTDAEVFCGLMFIYEMLMSGLPNETYKAHFDYYKLKYEAALKDNRIQWDDSTMDTLTETDDYDEVGPGTVTMESWT